MALGPGKYDAVCTLAREAANAPGVVLIVYEGPHGSGFSVQGPPEMMRGLPTVLRYVAKNIEDSLNPAGGTQ